MHYREDYGLETRTVRFHNIFGPLGTWDGGREKAPAAMCRKVAVAKLTGDSIVEIWGDGEQTRSFCYIDDCVEGIYRLMRSDYAEPLNLGQDRLISINELADMVAAAAGVRIVKKHVPGPAGRARAQLRQHPPARGARLGAARSRSRRASPAPTTGSRRRFGCSGPRPSTRPESRPVASPSEVADAGARALTRSPGTSTCSASASAPST